MGVWLRTPSHQHPQRISYEVLTASANERKVLDTKKDRLIEKGVRCIVADNGYVDKKRATAFAETDVLLLTPQTIAEANPLLGADPLYTATQVQTWQTARKTAIEPVFDLLSKVNHRGTQTFTDTRLALCCHLFGTRCLRVATRNVNESPRLPLRNITHIVFR